MNINPDQFPVVEIPFDRVLARLGYFRGKTQVDGETRSLIEAEIEIARRIMQPRQAVASSPVSLPGPGLVALEPGFVIRSNDIRQLLETCTAAYGFAVTIGPHLEAKRSAYLDARQTTRALVLDAAGSVAAEELAEMTHEQIRREAREQGLEATRRFSPGYGDWRVSGQKSLLRWLAAQRIGIRLTTSFQMLPEKSVSALVGVKAK